MTSSHRRKPVPGPRLELRQNGYEAGALAALTRFKQWTKEEVLVLASKARADGRKRDIHMIFNL